MIAAVVALLGSLAAQEPTYDQGGELPWDTDIYPTTIAGGFIGDWPSEDAAPSWETVELRWLFDLDLNENRRLAPSARRELALLADAERERLCEALAVRGDGRALLWLLVHRSGSPEVRAEGRRRDFDRLRRVEDERWIERGLLLLADDPEGIERIPLLSWMELCARSHQPVAVRRAALLARARLIASEQPARAEHLFLQAVRFFALGEARPGEESAAELRDLTARFLDALATAEREHAEADFVEVPDGRRVPDLVPAPDPGDAWRPAVELLAARGVPAARLWCLRTMPLDDAGDRESARAELAELCAAELVPEELAELASSLDWLALTLGADAVEPPLRALAARASEEAQRALFAGLARGLYLTPDGRTRGVALLEELVTRWPSSAEGQRAAETLAGLRALTSPR